MNHENVNPFDIDAIIEAKFSQLPPPQGAGYSVENVLAKNSSKEPQVYTLSNAASIPVASIETPIPAVDADAYLTPGFAHLNDLSKTSRHRIETRIGVVEFDGSALLCQCPDCGAPMTLRLWLRLGDCWRCPASVVLDEETIAEVVSGIQNEQSQTRARRVLPPPPPLPVNFLERPALETLAPVLRVGEQRADESETSIDSEELERLTDRSTLAGLIRRMFRITPAWLVSFLLHLIALLVLAMIFLGDQGESLINEAITLTTFQDRSDQVGGDMRLDNPDNRLEDDVALLAKMNIGERELRKVTSDAMELRVDPASASRLPELNAVRKNITTKTGDRMSFAARDPRVRAEIVEKEGGSNLTEAAVSRGLRWLASVQNNDGSWSLKEYRRSDRNGNKGDSMGTALALLPFLGAGQTHEVGIYRKTVAGGLKWLLENQKPDGDLRAGVESQAGMYAHGQATIVLCEALALSGDRQFLEPTQSAIRFIERAQHSQGGWRYRPRQAGDLSVFGWQMMALQSARAAGMEIQIDAETFELADKFLDSVASKKIRSAALPVGSTYAYQRGREVTATMTAEAILCRMYLGWRKDDPRLKAAVDWLIENHLPTSGDKNVYYWYYGTQVMHHYGGDPWDRWNGRLRTILVSTQDTRGRYPGSWNPKGFEWGSNGGRIYTTSMAVCTLEVYYRHLPLFKQLELE